MEYSIEIIVDVPDLHAAADIASRAIRLVNAMEPADLPLEQRSSAKLGVVALYEPEKS